MRFSSLVVTMPASSVREWLDHELEVRGIDAVVYTRYILSILQQDDDMHEPPEREFFPVGGKKKENVVKGKSKQKVNKTRIVDCEELKKTAAVECLMSVTEQKCGIKELVEELCSRLKSIQIEATYRTQESVDKPVLYETSCAITQCEEHSSPKEQAEKYYAAFPSLSGNSDFDDISGDKASSEQHNSVWDRKKIPTDTKESEECVLLAEDGATVAVVKSEGNLVTSNVGKFETSDGPTTSPSNFIKKRKTKTVTEDVTKKPQRHHQIKLKHITKLPKISRDHYVCCKPSFIVPKYKCRILKERVQFHKERSPFNLFELTTKCLSCKRELVDESCCSDCKKWEDNNDVDSSFEDGESEDATVSAHLPSEVSPAAEDVPLLKLEAKFNESLAAIWMELPIQSANTSGEGEKCNNDLMSWIASLHRVNDEADGFGRLLEMFDGHSHTREKECDRSDNLIENQPFPYADNNEKRFVIDNTGYLSILDHMLNGTVSRDNHLNICSGSSSETASLKNTEDSPRVWKCEGRVHSFIKGGVYGFEALENYCNGDDSSDVGTLAMDSDTLESCSPAFDSDGDALLEWWKEKTCDSAELREDDLKLIWEVLGTIGDSESAAYDNNTFTKQPGVIEQFEGEEESLTSSIWEQLDYLDRWKMDQDLFSNFTWNCAFGLSENAVGFDCRYPPINVWSRFDSETSTEKCKSMSSLIEEALKIQWKEEHDGFCNSLLDVCGGHTEDNFGKNDSNTGIIINALFPANTEELLKMTRSYDSYLNRGSEEGEFKENRLSMNHDASRHSDPNLFDKNCTLTYHKGESLFVEVSPRIETGLLSVDELGVGFLTDRFINVGELPDDELKREDASKPNELVSDEYDGENLLTSPMTHFRPIRQFSCDSDETASSVGVDVVDTSAAVRRSKVADDIKQSCREKVENVEEKPMFFEDENGILRLSDSNSDGIDNSDSRYMIYKCQDVKQEDAPSFVPKFKLRSDLEKFCQTEDPDGYENDDEVYGNMFLGSCCGDRSMANTVAGFRSSSMSGSKNVDEFHENDTLQEASCFDTCPLPFGNETNHAWGFTTSVFLPESCRRVVDTKNVEKPSGTDEKCIGYGIETLNFKEFLDPRTSSSWSVITCGSSKVVGDGQHGTSWPIVSSNYKKTSDDLGGNCFWSAPEFEEEATESEELKCMKEEIKNEEAELFEDINQMRALDLHNEWAEDNCNGDALEWPSTSKEIYQEASVDYHEDEDCPELEMINGGDKHEEEFEKWSHNIDDVGVEPIDEDDDDDDDDDEENDDGDTGEHLPSACVDYQLFEVPEEENDFLTNKFPSIPTSNVIYSSDLEEEWIRAGKPFDVQIPKINRTMTKSRCNRKPCSFFMDGSCRRNDCKFSHDLATITCRFWEEGSCFKGMTCPFLHGYPSISSPVFIVNSIRKEKNFKIESEADFPSLSKSVESTSSGGWISSAFSAKRKKKRNRIRHRSISIVSRVD